MKFLKLPLAITILTLSACAKPYVPGTMTATCSGSNLIIKEDFENCEFNKSAWSAIGDATRYDKKLYQPNSSQQPFLIPGISNNPPAPPKGVCVANYFLKKGTDETTPLNMSKQGVFDELYYCWYEYFKKPFPLSGQKFTRIGNSTGGGSTVYLEFSYFHGDSSLSFYVYDNAANLTLSNHSVPLRLAAVENRWSEWCVHAKQSDPGVSNGRIALWYDGAKVADSGDITTRSNNADWNFMWIGGNNSWGAGFGVGGGRKVPFDGNRYIAGIRVYDSYCGM